ncbi:MAG: septum site-determining protein MinC [Clostridia bacterium]|nr:septum site-determining protein MinC [Clostridia bacterium]
MGEDILKVKMRNNRLEIVVSDWAEYEQFKEELFKKLDKMAQFLNKGQSKVLFAGKEFTEGQKKEITGIIKTDYNAMDVDFCSLEQLEQMHKRQQMMDIENGIKPVSSVFKMGCIDSGTVLKSEGDMTIIGDVESGAEIIAKGSICILGVLRGSAIAGAGGDESAIIVANVLEAAKLGIGSCMGVAPKGDESIGVPEYAHIVDGKIVIEAVENQSAFDDEERQKGIISSIRRFFTSDN